MNTERTENTVRTSEPEWVLYDGGCPLCVNLAKRLQARLAGRGIEFTPLQTPWVAEKLKHDAGCIPSEMGVLRADGSYLGGAHAVMFLFRRIGWLWPIYAVSRFPGMMRVFSFLYRFIAARRHCFGGACTRRT